MNRSIALLFVLWSIWLIGPAALHADPYYNSSEQGCGTDPNVVYCEDFETNGTATVNGHGKWYALNCDNANNTGGVGLQTKGWCGTIYANPITPDGAELCGAGVTPFGNCVGNSGTKTGQGGRNFASRHFKTATCGTNAAQLCGVNELYVRWYAYWVAGYKWGGEKHTNFTNDDGDIAFANVQLNCGTGGASSTATPYIQVIHGLDICQAPNVSGITLSSGHWYFFEMHVRVGSSGVIDLWINDCGTAGTSCGTAPILRTHMTGNLPGNANGTQIETIWHESWANPASSGTGPYLDQIKASRVGPIGLFTGGAPSDTTPPAAPTGVAAR